jgi:carboxyl-terminal processing protease
MEWAVARRHGTSMDTTMRRWITSLGRTFASLLLVLSLGVGALSAQTAAPNSLSKSEVGEMLRHGRQLELERRWSEAVTYYEESLRHFPGEASLQRHFDFTRLHYDVGRRYADHSFRGLLTKLSFEQSLDLYGEVMLKVQSHYVEAPKWKELVERGTNSLEVALSESSFLKANNVSEDAPRFDAFRQELRRVLGPMIIQSRPEAVNAVTLAAQLGQQRLGLAPNTVVFEYTCGATNSLDPYSAYLTPSQLNEVYSQIEGNFVGLGIELKADNGALLIVRVITGSPAEHSGIVSGDRIVAVDGRQTADVSTDEAANLLQGKAGTNVLLTLTSSAGQSRDLSVQREVVDVPSVDGVKILDGTDHVGYLRLTCFQKNTCRELDDALWTLHRAGMRSLIVDLRGNPGGLLVSSVEAVDRFVAQGVIVSTRGRDSQEDFTYTAHEAGTWRMPLVVLIDQDSASAAEIFSGAIRDHRRGTIVGTRSYGKGSVQGIFPLNASDAGVRLTTAKFYSPNGSPYSGVGVEPNVIVRQVARPSGENGPALTAAQDAILEHGVQAVQQLMAQGMAQN